MGELFEGRKITPLVYDLDLERLAVRWAEYRGPCSGPMKGDSRVVPKPGSKTCMPQTFKF